MFALYMKNVNDNHEDQTFPIAISNTCVALQEFLDKESCPEYMVGQKKRYFKVGPFYQYVKPQHNGLDVFNHDIGIVEILSKEQAFERGGDREVQLWNLEFREAAIIG